MSGTTIIAIVAAMAIIAAVVIGRLKFRHPSQDAKDYSGNGFEASERTKRNKKDKQPDNGRDISAFNRLQQLIDANWIRNFENNQLAYPQYVQVAVMDDLHAYLNESRKTENEFLIQDLAEAHNVYIKSIKSFINTVLRETTFVRPESKASVVNSKAEGRRKWSNDYDQRYDREVKIIGHKAKGIINAYKKYVQVAINESVSSRAGA